MIMKLHIARDKDGSLFLYGAKPRLIDNAFWISGYNGTMKLKKELFPEVTFENSPQEVELKLVSEIVGITESPSKTFPRVNEFEVGASYRR